MSYDPNNKLTFDGSGHLTLTTSPTGGDNTTKAATTSFVQTAMASHSYNPAAVAISGGSINNTSVGATTRSTGAFTNGTVTSMTSAGATVSGTLTRRSALIRTVRVVSTSSPVTMTATDDVLVINPTGSPVTVTLPTSPATGRRVVVKDGNGTSPTSNITVQSASGTIDAAATSIINRAYGFADFIYNGTQWNALAVGGTVQAESPEGTTVTTPATGTTTNIFASKTTGSTASGSNLNTFALNSAGQVIYNGLVQDGTTQGGVVQTNTSALLALKYHSHGCFQHAGNTSFDDWWYWDTTRTDGNSVALGGNWTEYAISAVNLSNQTYAANAAANTVIGTISVVMTTTGPLSTFAGTFSVSDTTNFKISGNQLLSNAQLTQSSYSITITATPSPVGDAFTTATLTLTQTGGTVRNILFGTFGAIQGTPLTPVHTTLGYYPDYRMDGGFMAMDGAAFVNTGSDGIAYPLVCSMNHIDGSPTYPASPAQDPAAAAAGTYDSIYAATAQNIFQRFASQIYATRIDHEWAYPNNFFWSPYWPARGAQVPYQTWVTGWRRLAHQIRLFAPTVKIAWDYPIGNSGQVATDAINYYPGDDVYGDGFGNLVDIINCDMYWSGQTFAQVEAYPTYNLETMNTFANSKGKPMAFLEWGYTSAADSWGPSSDTSFTAWVKSHNVVAMSNWQNYGNGFEHSAAAEAAVVNGLGATGFGSGTQNASYTGSFWTYKTLPATKPTNF